MCDTKQMLAFASLFKLLEVTAMPKIKLSNVFDKIWATAEQRNADLGPVYGFNHNTGARFHRIFDRSSSEGKNGRYITMGIYDSVKKKHVLFNTINLSGNFRYNNNSVPAEFNEMKALVESD